MAVAVSSGSPVNGFSTRRAELRTVRIRGIMVLLLRHQHQRAKLNWCPPPLQNLQATPSLSPGAGALQQRELTQQGLAKHHCLQCSTVIKHGGARLSDTQRRAVVAHSVAPFQRPSGGPKVQNIEIVLQRLDKADNLRTVLRLYSEAKSSAQDAAFMPPYVLAAVAKALGSSSSQNTKAADTEELRVGSRRGPGPLGLRLSSFTAGAARREGRVGTCSRLRMGKPRLHDCRHA